MKKILLLSLLFLSGAGAAYAGGDTLNYIDVTTGFRQGHWIIWGRMQKDPAYAADAKVEEGTYQDSKKTGIWKYFFPNGKTKSEFTYVNNRPNGHAITYNENGTKYEEGTWMGNHWVGQYNLYYEDGTPRQSFNYNSTGQRNGTQLMYNPDGTLLYKLNIVNGKQQGWQEEYANGQLVKKTWMDNDVMDNSKTVVVSTEKPKPQKDPDDPSLDKKAETTTVVSEANWDGEGQRTLYQNGHISQKGFFHLHKLVDGEVRLYDKDGFCTQVKIFKGGKYVGDGTIPEEDRRK